MIFLQVATSLFDRFGLGPEHCIVTVWGTREPLSPEVLEKVQVFLQDECGALATGTVSHPGHWVGGTVDEGRGEIIEPGPR